MNITHYVCMDYPVEYKLMKLVAKDDELRECTSVDVFKKRLKTHLFHLHY